MTAIDLPSLGDVPPEQPFPELQDVPARRRTLRERVRSFVRDPDLLIGLFIWTLVAFMAALPALFTSVDPNAQELTARLSPPGTPGHVLGTDSLGQDLYSRIIYGARTSVLVGFGAILIGGLLGVTLGILGGYFKRIDSFVGMCIDIKMSFPGLLLALAVVAAVGHSSVLILCVVIGLIGWPRYARVVRSQVMSLRSHEFIVAARTSGSSSTRVIGAHVLPNVASTIGVLAVLDLSRAVLSEASLSFLGFGIQAPTVSWGLILADGQDHVYNAWWLVAFPGIAIAVVVLAANLIGTALQRRMDPAQQRRR